MIAHLTRGSLALAVVFLLCAGSVRAAEDTVIILDASGSMWGQINSEAKMTTAKRVLGDVLKNVPADRRLGLFAYGHRREGDCADIEQIAPLGASRTDISAAVGRLSPKGKTPMTSAVKQAAESLQYTEKKATVILVSDGIETCAADPCGAAATLEKAGADLTVHVIGFDVADENAQAQLRCIAENTGGRFVSAANATELSKALASTVIEPPPSATTSNLSLRATELQGGVVIEKGLTWTVTPSAGGAAVLTQAEAGTLDTTVPPGTYDVTAVRAADGLKGTAKDIVVTSNSQKTVTIALEFPVTATIRTEPEGKAVAGTDIAVHWTGPDRTGDFIAIAVHGAEAGSTERYAYTRLGSPAKLRLPVTPGAYEIRYVLGRPYRILATTAIEAIAAEATLSGPATGIAGAEVAVAFTGPPANASDYVTITKPEDPDTKYMGYAYTRNGSPAKLRLPLEAGAYEFRFVQNGSRVLARQAVSVVAAEARVSAKTEAIAGETIAIEFSGPPVGPSDYITVAAPDAPDKTYTDYAYVRNGSPAQVRMPLDAGAYEIRYVQAGTKVLARQPIAITPATATLDAPAEAKAGTPLAVGFTGPPPGPSDYIGLSESGAADLKYVAYTYARLGSPATIKIPAKPGAYELRFIQAGKKVLARRPITVTAP